MKEREKLLVRTKVNHCIRCADVYAAHGAKGGASVWQEIHGG